MNLQQQQEMGRLVPALALQPLDFVDAADDGLDTLIERRDIGILRQALQRSFEVEVRMLVHYFGKHLSH